MPAGARRVCLAGLAALVFSVSAASLELNPFAFYQALKSFELGRDNVVRVKKLQFTRDRLQMTLTGEIYFSQPVEGKVCGAVFLGEGELRVEPWSVFEQDNVKRFLKSDIVYATFKEAVFRFSDDTYEQLKNQPSSEGIERERAQKMASELEERVLRETGLNLSARLALADSLQDTPGVFFAQFDDGNRGRFSAFLDHQARVIGNVFDVNGGEKGLVFQFRKNMYGNDIWTAFYDQEDFNRGNVAYSDVYDLVAIPDYRMNIDLTDPGDWLRMEIEMDMVALRDGVQMIPMALNEGLSGYREARLNRGVVVRGASLADGRPVGAIQEPWESGFSLVLGRPLRKEEQVTVRLQLEGKDTLRTWESHFHYPRSTTTWYPRHGYLARSRYDLVFQHEKKYEVVSVGERQPVDVAGDSDADADTVRTRWVMRDPVALITFAVGRFDRHEEIAELDGQKLPLEFYSPPGAYETVKEDFVLAELSNGVRYFSALYGNYPYKCLKAVFFPAPFGQGFPTLLLLPVRGHARTREFAFISHEGAHQWWGNIVGWRSYRDQWLSEGFSEYSGALYTGVRKDFDDTLDLVKDMRRSLSMPPGTETGIASGKLYEVGPLILGHRLSSRRTFGAYSVLVYNKGALVLRMLHFLFRDPGTGEDKLFFDMMKDFVERHRDGLATTESFMQVAGEHFARSPLGKKYGLKDLNWFLHQWVYKSALPTYRLEYLFEPRQGGGVTLKGVLYQEGIPENEKWFMPLPLQLEFSGKRFANGTIHAYGPATRVEIPFPEEPRRVRLDPHMWVLSEDTSEKKVSRLPPQP